MSELPPKGDRIAKVIARAGVASRREAERLIQAGLVSVNGQKIDSPALNITDKDRVTVDGKPLAPPEPARIWMYHKPTGLVTTHSDEQGRPTIYDDLPAALPRVMSVGRLDLNSEGLLLLTNDGEVKRKLELPSTGWLRKYRVRVRGYVSDERLDPLRKGLTVDGERFQPMEVQFDRQQGANAWLTIGLREGKNREIRRAMEAVEFTVNRLIRVSYGPFQLGQLKSGEVEELRRKVVRDQLGLDGILPEEEPRGKGPKISRKGPGKPSARRSTEYAPHMGRGRRDSAEPSAAGKPSGRFAERDEPRGGARHAGKSSRTGMGTEIENPGRRKSGTGGKPSGGQGGNSYGASNGKSGGRSGGGKPQRSAGPQMEGRSGSKSGKNTGRRSKPRSY
ncbi:MAG: rRNA pseudouridine synthase [Thalassovita sp.]